MARSGCWAEGIFTALIYKPDNSLYGMVKVKMEQNKAPKKEKV